MLEAVGDAAALQMLATHLCCDLASYIIAAQFVWSYTLRCNSAAGPLGSCIDGACFG